MKIYFGFYDVRDPHLVQSEKVSFFIGLGVVVVFVAVVVYVIFRFIL